METKHTKTPWKVDLFCGTPEDQAQSVKFGMKLIPSLTNEGQRYIMAGEGDDRKRVALVDCHARYKHGTGHQQECAERDANAAHIVRACNSHQALVEALELIAGSIDSVDQVAYMKGIARAALLAAKG